MFNQFNGKLQDKIKSQPVTAVWQNGGFSVKLNISSSIELLCKIEYLFFDFRHFAKLQTVRFHAKSDTANAHLAHLQAPTHRLTL